MGGLGTTCGETNQQFSGVWYQVFQSGYQGLGGCLGGFATINHFEEAIYVKNYAWWILTWRFYSALAGTPKKSVKVRGLDHPNMTGDFRKSGGYWIHKSTKSLDSKFLSGTPERGSGDSKTSDVILLANDIWAAKSWNKRDPALYDNLWKIEMIIEDTAFLIVNHPLAMIKHTLTFPQNSTS